jgi:DNA-directed RNA polymerase specialized sigma24 family protein
MDSMTAAATEAHPPTFEDFYRSQWAGAVRLGALVTQNPAAGEEIAQDAFARIYSKWATTDNPPAYLRVSVLNGCRQWHRRNAVRQAKLPLLVTGDDVAASADELALLVAALPFRQRAVLVLRYYADLTEQEIAATLSRSASAHRKSP